MKRIMEKMKDPRGMRWLFYGDSITHGAKHATGYKDFSELFRERVAWELGRRDDLVLNSAYSGFTTNELLENFDGRAAFFRPDAAFLMIGTNDTVKIADENVFRRNLNELAERFEKLGTQLVLLTPLPVFRNLDADRGAAVPAYAGIVRETAAARGLPLIDEYRNWETDPAAVYLYADELHPNNFGHVKIAHDIFRALGIFDEKSWTCRFFVPPAL